MKKEYKTPGSTKRKLVQICDELGVAYVDRERSCPHKTEYCTRHCYYNKFFMYPSVKKYLRKAGVIWNMLTGKDFSGHARVRLCKVGDPFSTVDDIERVFGWARENPKTVFKAPTRAWRNAEIRACLEQARLDGTMPKNLRILASLDPSNTQDEIASLVASGWSTMFFGNDAKHPVEKNVVRCAKTWKHAKGHCKRCNNGCFSSNQKHIWLKKH